MPISRGASASTNKARPARHSAHSWGQRLGSRGAGRSTAAGLPGRAGRAATMSTISLQGATSEVRRPPIWKGWNVEARSARPPSIVKRPTFKDSDSSTGTRLGSLRWRPAVFLALFLVSLLPRLVGLGEATTEDEDQWIQRSGNFARALDNGQWQATYQVGHPGVSAMWLTSLSLGHERARQFATEERSERLVTQVEDFLPALRAARLRFAIVNAALAAACGLLAWRLFGFGPGLLAGVLLAFDPYWVAMSPIVGMDGLLAGLMGVSLLSALLAFRDARSSGSWALLSGLTAGLALLTKGPAVLILPMVLFLSARGWWQAGRRSESWRAAAHKLTNWVLAFIAVLTAWPAMWVNPLGTAGRTADFIRGIGTTPHGPGNFFLGQPVADPGPLFYPVAVALHLGPATLLGLVALVAIRPPPACRGTLGTLVDFAVLFGLALTVSPKKVDRYILPLMPILGVLAAVGWWQALCHVARWRWRRAATGAAGVVMALLAFWPLIMAGRHPLSAYNPLLGGPRTAEQVLPVGWGEGLDAVGAYLERQAGREELVTAIWYPLYVNFQAHAPGRVVNITFRGPGQVSNEQLLEQADYYVDYIHARQRQLTPGVLVGRQPDFVETANGIEYARVYRLK
jgi:hypothetical protein